MPSPRRPVRIPLLLGTLIILAAAALYLNLPALRRMMLARASTARLVAQAHRDPNDAGLTAEAGRRLLDEGRGAEAWALLQRLVRTGSASPEAVVLAARSAAAAGAAAEADRLFEAARTGAPREAGVQAWVGFYLIEQGLTRQGRAQCELALRLRAEEPVALLGLGKLGLLEQQFTTALTLARQSRRRHPAWQAVHLEAEALKELGLPGEAESPAREAVRRGRNPATLRTLSEILFQQGGTDRTAEAEELLRAALAHSPEDPVTLQALAVQLRSRDEHREAVRLLRRLLRARPFTVEAYPLLIHSYRSLGNVTTAADVERIYRVLLPRDSRLARARFLASVTEGSPASLTHLARAYLDAGTPDQARLLLARPPLAGIATPELVQLRRRAEQASPYQAPALPADPEGDAP